MTDDWLLFDNPLSGNCWKARQILTATGVPFLVTDVPVTGDREAQRSGTPVGDYHAGRIPLLVGPNEERVAESGAILLKFGEGSSYLPAGGDVRQRVLEWLFFEQSMHMPYLAAARFLCVVAKQAEQKREVVEFLRERGRLALRTLERHLAKEAASQSGWLTKAGRMTIADIALYPYTRMAAQGGIGLEEFGAVRQWLSVVEADPKHLRLPPGIADAEGGVDDPAAGGPG